MPVVIITAVSVIAVVSVLTFVYLKRTKAEHAQQDLLRETHKKQQNQAVIAPPQETPAPEVLVTENIIADEIRAAEDIEPISFEPDELIDTDVTAEITEAENPPVVTEVIDNKVEIAEEDNDAEEIAEEESLLKRHHLSHIRMMLANTSFPRPSDNALSRHYDAMIDDEAEKCLQDDNRMERLLRAYENYRKTQFVDFAPDEPKAEKITIPEDATLRRHYIAQLRATIEQEKAARPTDSALRRHYDAMITAEVDNHLTDD